MDRKLIAIVASGRAFALELSDSDRGNLDLALEGMIAGKGTLGAAWLPTEEGFRIRRDAVVALVVGRKEGEWAVADRA